MSPNGSLAEPTWTELRTHFRSRGLRWTPQRRLILEVLERTSGHVTGSELVERCRALDPETTPSTVYRTLRVLEELGLVRHGHGADGREEFHVRPGGEHGHLYCHACGSSWEIDAAAAAETVAAFRQNHGFSVDLTHLTIVGRCRACQDQSPIT
jgi:Fur family transcriptional regulator, ferric uptake regulator